jgi:hypothetical protein
LSDLDKNFVVGALDDLERTYWKNLQKLYTTQKSGLDLEFERKEASCQAGLAEVEAMRRLLREGRVQVGPLGQSIPNQKPLAGGYTISVPKGDGSEFAFHLDFATDPRVGDCKARIDSLREFALIHAISEFNNRPLAERREAGRQDRARRSQLEVLDRELRNLSEKISGMGTDTEERAKNLSQMRDIGRRRWELLRSLLALPVDETTSEMILNRG